MGKVISLLKFHQFFSFGILGVLFGSCLVIGIFSYNNQNRQNQKITHEKLKTMGEIVDISILEGSLNKKFLKDLERRSGIAIVVIDKNNTKIYASDNKFLSFIQTLDVASQAHFGNIQIQKENYIFLTQNTLIDDIKYHINLFINEKSKNYQDFWVEFLILFGIFLLPCLYLIFLIKKLTKSELNIIAYYLEKLTKRDFEGIKDSKLFFEEFKEISKLIIKLSIILQKQEKKVKKNSKKLRLKYLQSSSIVSALSHEFKNPLAVISGYCETIMQMETKNQLNAQARERFLNKIYGQCARLNALLNRLNLAVRLENDLAKLEISTFNLKTLVEEIASNLITSYPNKMLSLGLKNIEISADKLLLEQVITNLIENGLKYCKQKVKVILKKDVFKVLDDGDGFDKSQTLLITKKFYRIQNHKKNKSQENSIGLGLFIVKYILKLHHIELKIESEQGKGSCFSFSI